MQHRHRASKRAWAITARGCSPTRYETPGRWRWRCTALLATALLVQGCMPRSVLVHDGLDTTVLDQQTQQPLAGVSILDAGVVVAHSDAQGRVQLAPQRTLKLVPLMGEARISLSLLACKDGYLPTVVAERGGWNADYSDSQVHRTPIVLQPATGPQATVCAGTGAEQP